MRRVKAMKIEKGMTVDQLVREMGSSGAFGAGRLAEAVDIYEEMYREKATKFFGLAGAMVPAGMRGVVVEMLRQGYIDVLVTTGANLAHDLLEAFGGHHYKGSSTARDERLRDEGISRVFDVFLPEKDFLLLEKGFRRILEGMEGDYTIRSFLAEVGRGVRDRRSILRAATDVGVPVFCPGLADSMLGLHAWLEAEKGRLRVDALRDMKEIVELCFQVERSGAVFIGGGVPKNFILQAMLVSPNTFDYAIQVTMDRPETGGLSGATLEEAVSWGKVGKKARRATVYADATIALPMIFAALLERTKK